MYNYRIWSDLSFRPLEKGEFIKLKSFLQKSFFKIEEIGDSFLELEYEGKDIKKCIKDLQVIASLIRDAEEEIFCERDEDTKEYKSFYFLRIRDSHLFFQKGKIVRDSEEKLDESKFWEEF